MFTLTIHDLGHFKLYEASGTFTVTDIWQLVGERSRVATFTFVEGSVSKENYGTSIVAAPLYTREERENPPGSIVSAHLRFQVLMKDRNSEHMRALKYFGVPIADIAVIQFLPLERPVEYHDTGEKKIPNVIEIPFEPDPTLSEDLLTQSYLVSKNNQGVELLPFEKSQLLGITLGLNRGHIDSRILGHLGYDKSSAAVDPEVTFYRLTTQERSGGVSLSEHEEASLADLRLTRRMQVATTVIGELKKCRADRLDPGILNPILGRVLESAFQFTPEVLLHGTKQVYWDLGSYAHITLRHVRGLQVKQGTIFPYRAVDLKLLIVKVLGDVQDEIWEHFESKPGKMFFLAGRRCVFFNDDYYSLHIEASGRLANFHRCERPKPPVPV